MMLYMRLAATIAVAWMLAEAFFPNRMANLPFAGQGINQLGVAFILVYLVAEIVEVIKRLDWVRKEKSDGGGR